MAYTVLQCWYRKRRQKIDVQKKKCPNWTGPIRLCLKLQWKYNISSYRTFYNYCIRQYFRVQIFSRIWPKFLQILSSREFNFAILVVLSLVQIDMNQSEDIRDKWFAKFTKIKPPRNIPRIQYIKSCKSLQTLLYQLTSLTLKIIYVIPEKLQSYPCPHYDDV